jgi:hypothetical protein
MCKIKSTIVLNKTKRPLQQNLWVILVVTPLAEGQKRRFSAFSIWL